jgi:DNA helicase-2/ATP-dependent DNA helicase PcrA
MTFTPEQKRIFSFISHGTGHGIINAVAGAGKTTTIMECARLVKDKSSILFCAFNNSIASEIGRKFHQLGLNDVTVKTIHALGRQILQDNNNSGQPLQLEGNKYFEILHSPDIQKTIKPHLKTIFRINGFPQDELGNRNNFAAMNLLNRIHNRLLEVNQKFRATLAKDDLAEFEELVTHFGIFTDAEIRKKDFKQEVKEYFHCHQFLLEAGNEFARRKMVIDYTDMLYLPYQWEQYPGKKYQFLFIDECQDLSKSQFGIAAKYGKKDGRILAVGDPQQSIYGFTGADILSFARVEEYTKAQSFPLTNCFRCPQSIIQLAQTIRQDIIGNKQLDGIVTTILFDEVVDLAKAGDLIISRLRAPIVLLVFNFIDKNIKVKIHEEEVKEVINEIRNIFKQEELQLSISGLAGGFERLKSTVKKRWYYIIEKNADRIINNTERRIYVNIEKKYLNRKLEFLHKKYEQWKNGCRTVNDILLKVKDFISAVHNPINLSTIHRAKGLENERVFILNYDELPYHRQHQKEWEKMQELNLKYVAITRSYKELYLVENKKTDVIEEEESLFDNFPFE